MADDLRPWNCTFCFRFHSNTLGSLMKHIRNVHNGPAFHCHCGVDGCTSIYKSVKGWEKHVRKKHPQHLNAVNHEEGQGPIGMEFMEDEDGGILVNDEGIEVPYANHIVPLPVMKKRNAPELQGG